MIVFSGDQAVIDQGNTYLRIAVFIHAFPEQVDPSRSGASNLSLLVGVDRQFVAQGLIIWPLAYGLDRGTTGVWWAILIATWTGVAFSLFIVLCVARKELDLDAPATTLVSRDWLPAAVEFR